MCEFKTCNGFLSCPLGYILLPIKHYGKMVDITLIFIPTSYKFQVNLGTPWLYYMKAMDSPIHRCLKVPHDGRIKYINHS